MEFKAFPKIERIGKVNMAITQKIHGTNAQVFIYPDESGTLQLLCGSRTRWIYPGDDNYGFAAHVHAHKEEFIRKLGPGQHFGEWAGLGINSGEGLDEKVFVLFDFWKYPPERELPPKTTVVPVLYQGPMDLGVIETVMAELKANGSRLAPGFMRPEGVVITAMGTRYKKVFDAEETAWKKGDEKYAAKKQAERDANFVDYSHLLQPIRLEKLLSRDERYIKNFPKSLKDIANDYFDDLIAEGQITGSEGEINGIRKAASGQVFKFIRESVQSKHDELLMEL
jgi:hypothetical protein